MDTKQLEMQAESFIVHKLIKHGFHVSKPTFDKQGADLLIIDDINNKFTKTIRVQCKGRTIRDSSTNIVIPVAYVEENFLVFLYVVNGGEDDLLFVFFSEDIIQWRTNTNNYALNVSSSKLSSEEFARHLFSLEAVNLMRSYLFNAPIKRYTTVLIDQPFLESAIKRTIEVYEEIYPKRKLNPPLLQDVVKNIIAMYNNFRVSDLTINCHLYSYEENIPSETTVSKITIDSNVTAKLYREITDKFISFEMLDHLERVVNTENIILVSNEVIFDKELQKLSERGVEVTMVLYSSHEGRNIYAEQKWGDIMYPVAKAMGLEQQEW